MKNEKIIECRLCGNKVEPKYLGYPGYKKPETFDIYNCYNCNTSFSYPEVDTDIYYDTIYNNGKTVPGYERYWRYMKLVRKFKKPLDFLAQTEDMYWGVQQALKLYVKDKESQMLEIGSGLGYLTYSIMKEGYNIKGIDISKSAVENAIKNYGDHYLCTDLFEFSKANEGIYDVVILTEVIEHLDQPMKFVEAIKKLLKPGGITIITTPNKDLFPSEIIWATENPPVHCWWFSEKSFEYMAEKNRMSLKFIDFSEYYRKHYSSYELQKFRNIDAIPQILGENGELLQRRNPYSIYLRYLLAQFPLIKNSLLKIKFSYMRYKDSKKTDLVTSSQRSYTLCAVLKKSQ